MRKIGIRRSLKELPNYDCVLLDPETRKCRAYTARPRQCRTWPFWDSNSAVPRRGSELAKFVPEAAEESSTN